MLISLHKRGTGELAPNLVLRKGGASGVIGLRGGFLGTRRENLLRRCGQSILLLNILKMNLRSKVSLRFSRDFIFRLLLPTLNVKWFNNLF